MTTRSGGMTKEQEDMVMEFLKMVEGKAEAEKFMMRQNGFVIDNLDDRWQKLAFTLYTDILRLSTGAWHILEYLRK